MSEEIKATWVETRTFETNLIVDDGETLEYILRLWAEKRSSIYEIEPVDIKILNAEPYNFEETQKG